MRIGIDARFVGPQGTGLGKYTAKLIQNLSKIDKDNEYFIFLHKNNWNYLSLKEKKFTKVLADVLWYSLGEQLKMPQIYKSAYLDLLHVPHFNVPLFYRGRFVVTIHDLIHHHFREQSATTKSQIIFKIKRLGYNIVINNAVKRSKKIIVPSNFVKEEIVRIFKIDPSKIVITYEAAEEEYFKKTQNSKLKTQNYLLYVGNAYPHKNLNILLDAMTILKDLNLVIVCPRDIFFERLNQEIRQRNLAARVTTYGYLPPERLISFFKKASAYVFPSLSEGFGIPGLNAMAAGLPVIASDIPVLHEIYQDAAMYFNPNDAKDIAIQVERVIRDPITRRDLVEKGRKQAKKYSWQKMARETLQIYKESA